jgi:penicillin-binding protein 1A
MAPGLQYRERVIRPTGIQRRLDALREEWLAVRRQHPVLAKRVMAGALLASALTFAAGIWYTTSLLMDLPSRSQVERIGEMDQATAVYDRDDQIAFTIYKEQRIEVPLSRVSPSLIHAVIAIEDQRFYDHHGFDLIRIAAAAIGNLRSGRAAQGGSTITQQLARQSFLSADKTYRRKIQELILASRIERMYSKDRILELYLNKVYFGGGLYGVEAAARGYFAKHASELTVEEAALLAGLVQSPSRYSPTINRSRAKSRRNVVLQAMLDTHAIDKPTWEAARASAVSLKDGLHSDEPFGQYFKEQVRIELVQRFGWERVYQGGLRVFSTIDTGMQQAAESAVAERLKELDVRVKALAARRSAAKAAKELPAVAVATAKTEDPPLQAALIAMDPTTGQVRAMVGGRNFDDSHFNRASQAKRQPGSAFKPLVYAAALEAGYTPATMIDHLNDPIDTLQGAWTPEEGHSGADSMSLRTALRTSSNRASVRLLEDVGISKAVSYAKTLGVGEMPSVPSLALGSGEVTLQSLTAAYGAFANHGFVSTPQLIRRVEDRAGTVLYSAPQISTRAIKDTTAYLMANMMADVVNAGTAARIRSLGFALPAAGKTGTTNDFHDAWFIGFTPTLLAGVWVGFDQPKTILPNGFAADIAVPLWTSFMKTATKGAPAVWLKAPTGIVAAKVCRLSGKLATDACDSAEVVDGEGRLTSQSMTYTEYFAAGTQPTESCDLHRPHNVLTAIASFFHHDKPTPPPPTLEQIGAPQVVAAAAPAVVATAPTVAEVPVVKEKEKRGFWSKVFGIGKKDKEKK